MRNQLRRLFLSPPLSLPPSPPPLLPGSRRAVRPPCFPTLSESGREQLANSPSRPEENESCDDEREDAEPTQAGDSSTRATHTPLHPHSNAHVRIGTPVTRNSLGSPRRTDPRSVVRRRSSARLEGGGCGGARATRGRRRRGWGGGARLVREREGRGHR